MAIADPKTYLRDLVRELQATWPNNRTITIVCHGHSVPAGYFKTPIVDSFRAYPHLWHRAIKERFPNAVVNVIVTAIGGEDSERGAARFERDVLSLRPDLVTIDYGLNDRRIGLVRGKSAWESQIARATAAKSRVLLLTPTHDNSGESDPDAPNWRALGEHATQIRALAVTHDVGLVDSFSLWNDAIASGTRRADLLSQSNHPSERGHKIVADALAAWFPSTA